MNKAVVIAVDAMGGENAPTKILYGISECLKTNKNVFFKIFGPKTILENEISKTDLKKEFYEIINCDE